MMYWKQVIRMNLTSKVMQNMKSTICIMRYHSKQTSSQAPRYASPKLCPLTDWHAKCKIKWKHLSSTFTSKSKDFSVKEGLRFKWKSKQVVKPDPRQAAWSPDRAMRLTPINSKDQINVGRMMQCSAFWHHAVHILPATQVNTYYSVPQHCDSKFEQSCADVCRARFLGEHILWH